MATILIAPAPGAAHEVVVSWQIPSDDAASAMPSDVARSNVMSGEADWSALLGQNPNYADPWIMFSLLERSWRDQALAMGHPMVLNAGEGLAKNAPTRQALHGRIWRPLPGTTASNPVPTLACGS